MSIGAVASDRFLELWRDPATPYGRVALAVITIPGGATITVGTTETLLPGGGLYESGLRCDPIRARMGRLDPGPNPVDTAIYLEDVEFAGLGAKARSSVFTQQWHGARVQLYLWWAIATAARAPDSSRPTRCRYSTAPWIASSSPMPSCS